MLEPSHAAEYHRAGAAARRGPCAGSAPAPARSAESRRGVVAVESTRDVSLDAILTKLKVKGHVPKICKKELKTCVPGSGVD